MTRAKREWFSYGLVLIIFFVIPVILALRPGSHVRSWFCLLPGVVFLVIAIWQRAHPNSKPLSFGWRSWSLGVVIFAFMTWVSDNRKSPMEAIFDGLLSGSIWFFVLWLERRTSRKDPPSLPIES